VFDRAIASELFRYGRNVLGGTLILYLATNMDNAFVSRTSGTAALGQYAMAYNIANLPATHVGDVVGRVLLPSLVEINDDEPRLRRAYAQALRLVVVATFPLLAGLAAVATPFVHVLLGAKWAPAIPALQILTIFAALRVVSSATGSLLLATNNSRVILINGVVGLTVQAVALFVAVVLYDGGLVGASWAVSLSSIVNGLYIGMWVHRVLPFNVAAAARGAVRLVAPAVLMGLAVYALTLAAPLTWWALALEVATGVVLYLPLLVLCNGVGLGRDLLHVARARAA
jgi:O-antigen/teichoic acid export membrane protein